MKTRFADLLELGAEEKLDLLEYLWESLAATPEAVPVWNCQKKELGQRAAKFRKNPDSAIPWEEAKKRIRNKNG